MKKINVEQGKLKDRINTQQQAVVTQVARVLDLSSCPVNNEVLADVLKTFCATHQYQLNEFSARKCSKILEQYFESCASLNALAGQLKSQYTPASLKMTFLDWRLPLMLWLNKSTENPSVAQTINTLTWLQKNKAFLAKCFDKNNKLHVWLVDKTVANNTVSGFTQALKALCSQTQITNGLQLPRIMDVRTLWHSLSRHVYMKNLNPQKIDRLLSTRHTNIGRAIAYDMDCKQPSPESCFIESLSDNQSDSVLNVEGDVLRALLLSHPDNAQLSELIASYIPALNTVIESYSMDGMNQQNVWKARCTHQVANTRRIRPDGIACNSSLML